MDWREILQVKIADDSRITGNSSQFWWVAGRRLGHHKTFGPLRSFDRGCYDSSFTNWRSAQPKFATKSTAREQEALRANAENVTF